MKGKRKPDHVGWFVIEADVDPDRDRPVHSFLTGPFATKKKAEREAEQKREAWEAALEEWDDGNPYEYKDFSVVEHSMSDRQLARLDRMDEDRFQTRMDAADAVGASLVAEETGMDVEELMD
jgi:hypothetical protein